MAIDNKRIDALRLWCNEQALQCVERAHRATNRNVIAVNEQYRLNYSDLARICDAMVAFLDLDATKRENDQLRERVAELEALVVRYSAMVDGFVAVMENPLRAKDLLEFCEPVEVDDNASVEVVIVTAAPKGWAVAETDHD